MSIVEGSVLNERYKLLKLVGTGGMAIVYKAEDIETGEIVAIKILKEEYCDNEEFVKRFKNEAYAASKLSHTNIVSVYEVKNDNDNYYIVMEYVDGLTLKDYLTGLTSLQDRDALKITAQILSAVEYAHSCGIIHRDIKPMNIMISNEGIVKLTDFGIARAVTGETISTSGSAGSVHYISPEQARGGYTDERSDIYSIGITLYEMLMGVVPFDGDNVVAVAMKHMKERIVPPKEIDSDIPAGVNDLVIMATQKDPSKRFQTAAEMLAMVRKVLTNPAESFLKDEDDDVKIAAVRVPEEDIINVRRTTNDEKDGEDDQSEEQNSEDDDDVEYIVSGTDDALYTNKGERARTVIIAALSYVLAFAASFVLIVWLINHTKKTNDNMQNLAEVRYTLENYVGKDAESVIAALDEKGVKVNQKPKVVENGSYPDGLIVSQSLAENTEVRSGDVLEVEVSSSSGSFCLEDYSNKDFREVNQTLVSLGMKTSVTDIYSQNVEESFVVRTYPAAGTIVTPGETIIIYNSCGSLFSSFSMPDLTGKTLEEAQQILDSYEITLKQAAPNPGQDVDVFLGRKSPEPVYTPTPTPTVRPLFTPEPSASPEPSETPEATPSASLKPNTTQTPVPTATPAPTPTPTSTPEPRIAATVVMDQYPKPGATVYSHDEVCLYFYNIDELRKTKTMYFDMPTEIITPEVMVEIIAKPVDGDYPDTVVQKDIFKVEEFPIKYTVPLAMNGGYTEVLIKIFNSEYSVIYVYDD